MSGRQVLVDAEALAKVLMLLPHDAISHLPDEARAAQSLRNALTQPQPALEQEGRTSINVNEQVYVRLSKKGVEALEAYYRDLRLRAAQAAHEYLQAPAPDDDGLHRFQWHHLMQIFGDVCALGLVFPFEGGDVFLTRDAALANSVTKYQLEQS